MKYVSKKRDEQIGSMLGNVLQGDLGYNVLNSNVVSIYPYTGLSLRMANLSYRKTGTVNKVLYKYRKHIKQ